MSARRSSQPSSRPRDETPASIPRRRATLRATRPRRRTGRWFGHSRTSQVVLSQRATGWLPPHRCPKHLLLLKTPHRTRYAFNLHVQDVGRTLELGATGSGKSFLLNFLITHAQKYAPQTVVLHVGHSLGSWRRCMAGSIWKDFASTMSRSMPRSDADNSFVVRHMWACGSSILRLAGSASH